MADKSPLAGNEDIGMLADAVAQADGYWGGAGGARDAIRPLIGASYYVEGSDGVKGFFKDWLADSEGSLYGFALDWLNAQHHKDQGREIEANRAMTNRTIDKHNNKIGTSGIFEGLPFEERYDIAKDLVNQQLQHYIETGELDVNLPKFDLEHGSMGTPDNMREVPGAYTKEFAQTQLDHILNLQTNSPFKDLSVMEKARAEILEPIKEEINQLRANGQEEKAIKLTGGAKNLYGQDMDFLILPPRHHNISQANTLSKKTKYYKLDEETEDLLQKEQEFYNQDKVSYNIDKALEGGQRFV